MPYLTVKDGAEIFYKDWGSKEGQPVVFSHGWPLTSDNWEIQMFFLASKGYRAVAHDRRGHGRSSQPWEGNDIDTWADDLLQLIEHLDLKDVMLVGHSTGGGEIVRFCGRHGTSRVSKAVIISGTPPLLVKTEVSPDGVPIEVFDGFRAAMLKDRAQFFLDVPTGPFFGFNRPGVAKSQGMIDSWFRQGMQSGFKATFDCLRSWETDLRGDLESMDIPVLVIQGDDDQVVPVKAGALATIKFLKKGTLKIYPGGAHALPNTEAEGINEDLLHFLKE
ncbi:putative hydrolases or acyltransferase [Nemania sp. FL0031]|nr:putative hydrolases or acyltransferase [Nemania sp. FL0031]